MDISREIARGNSTDCWCIHKNLSHFELSIVTQMKSAVRGKLSREMPRGNSMGYSRFHLNLWEIAAYKVASMRNTARGWKCHGN